MEKTENTPSLNTKTVSNASDFTGAPVTNVDRPEVVLRSMEHKTLYDTNELGSRLFDLLHAYDITDGLSYGPGNSPLKLFSLAQLLKLNEIFISLFNFYAAVRWESVTFRVTLSNPKGIAGGVFVGCYPWQQWNSTAFMSEASYHDLNLMTRQRLLTAPETHLMTYGAGEDVVFTVPWQFNTAFVKTLSLVNFIPNNHARNPLTGMPTFFICDAGSSYVSTISKDAKIRVYVTFDGLTFEGPSARDLNLEKQSGMEIAPVVAALAVESAVATGVEVLSNAVGSSDDFFFDQEEDGSYTKPSAVQLSYVGDSTSIGKPPTAPVFRPPLPKGGRHKLSTFIGRPQYVGTFDTSTVVTRMFYADPINPTTLQSGSNRFCSFLSFYGAINSFWRGTINYDFVIMGHPMVEVQYSVRLHYPPRVSAYNLDVSQQQIYKGICSGTARVSVPCPFFSEYDMIPVVDEPGNAYVPCVVEWSASVVSTMLDTDPSIPVAVFISAGSDFTFYQPYPPGLGYVEPETSGQKQLRLKNKIRLQKQCGLPPVTDQVETRALTQEPVSTMPSMEYVEDYTQIWARALPYHEFDGQSEPTPSLKHAADPYWWPCLVGGTDPAHTLDVNNSWWVTNDYVSYVSSMFLYYRGSIALKILCDDDTSTYKYVTMRLPYTRQQAHCPYTYSPSMVPPESNFGFGAVLTPNGKQPVLDLTVPSRSVFAYGLCNPQANVAQTVHSQSNYGSNGTLDTNVVLHVPEGDLKDALFRKAGEDFSLYVSTLVPPPTLWATRGNHWS